MAIFSDAQLKAAIDEQHLDPTLGSHAIIVAGNEHGLQLVIAATFHGGSSTWQVQGVGAVDDHAKFTGEARVVVQW